MKTELNLRRRLKGLLCVTLSMVMFFGMTLGVQAANSENELYYCPTGGNPFFHYSDTGADVDANEKIQANSIISLSTSGGTIVVCINGVEKTKVYNDVSTYTVPSPPEKYTFTTSLNASNETYTLNLLPVAPAGNNEDSHTHSYTWQTISEATETQDGEEAYICDCGDVAEQKIISASGFYWNEMIKKIKEAKAGDSLVFTSNI